MVVLPHYGGTKLLMALLLSATLGFRTISLRSAGETDVVIGDMRTRLRYNNICQAHPFNVNSPQGGDKAWLELEMYAADVLRWVNTHANETSAINNTLYDILNELSI